ncbi:unnamed protein product [Didymodactylos carnosus]|uniref:Uncharacterized protein n=2 Tax=Didymodactylos carnosus TaxID=1234261 RepID=A0A814QBM3_9BILA|nr:unnamed protein product [Didymodactylos carnosus]CAF3880844.1 unnamed protein product [Didymodactylos carnosus]
MAAKVGDIDHEDNILTTKLKLTRNEYNATIRNKLEYNRLRVIVKYINEQSDSAASKQRTTTHNLKRWLNDNQTVVCNTDEFFFNRKINIKYEQNVAHAAVKEQEFIKKVRKEKSEQIEHFDISEKEFYRFGVRVNSFNPPVPRQRPISINAGARPNRVQSAGSALLKRPSTAPIKMYNGELSDEDTSDDEITRSRIQSTTLNSRITSSVHSTPTVLSHHPQSSLERDYYDDNKSTTDHSNTKISWPVRLRVFALQDEDEARKQWLAWKAEQRKAKRRNSKQFLDVELERQYRESIRRRQEIEAFLTPEIIENAKLNDPIFAKRYRQLKLAVKAGKLPAYDRNDTEINLTMTKSKIERARTALISAKQSKIKNIYRAQQINNDKNLSRRIEFFLKNLENFRNEQTV